MKNYLQIKLDPISTSISLIAQLFFKHYQIQKKNILISELIVVQYLLVKYSKPEIFKQINKYKY
jgi:hypothetical protein